MKKALALCAVVAISLTLFSFRATDETQASYEVVTDLGSVDLGVAASFTSSYKKGTDVVVTWEEWHKYWTLTESASTVQIASVLAAY